MVIFASSSLLIVGFALMFVFVVFSVVSLSLYYADNLNWRQLVIALGALTSPIFAFTSTFGICALVGLTFYPLLLLAPYLILAIGVDDAFLIMHQWHQSASSTTSKPHLSQVLAVIGPSILITSLTN